LHNFIVNITALQHWSTGTLQHWSTAAGADEKWPRSRAAATALNGWSFEYRDDITVSYQATPSAVLISSDSDAKACICVQFHKLYESAQRTFCERTQRPAAAVNTNV
jgi:hypothetical protein